MDLVAFYLGRHDSNMCAIADGVLRYRKFERRSGIKHERATLDRIAATCAEWDLSPSHVAFSDGNRNDLGSPGPDELFREVAAAVVGLPGAEHAYCVDHHLAHALSAWVGRDEMTDTAAVAIDGRGDNGCRARAFHIGAGLDISVRYESRDFTLGRFFNTVGARVGLGGTDVDHAGKLMGLQAYGTADGDALAALPHDAVEELPRRLLYDVPFRGVVPAAEPTFFDPASRRFLDWLATCHEALGRATASLFARLAGPGDDVVFAGGCAQNSVFNQALATRHPRLTIPAHCYDGGISLGCLELLVRLLGTDRPPTDRYPFLQDDEDVGFAGEATQQRIAALLADGRIVGWMQGRGEIGPRALGHRSILFDPCRPGAKDTLNGRVKFREPWRPFAGSVPVELAGEWFDLDGPSPLMQRAVPVRAHRAGAIPGIVHEDRTCRIQTVDDSAELASFAGVIAALADRTGTPLVLNTSLNSDGEPIYGSRRQALALLATGRLDALCIGDTLVTP